MSKMMFAIEPPSTTAVSPSLGWLSAGYSSSAHADVSDVLPVVFPRKNKLETVNTPAGRVSGRRGDFLAHVMINSPAVNAMFINAGLGHVEYTWLNPGGLGATHMRTSSSNVRHRSAEFEASAFEAWTSDYFGSSATELSEILSSIQAVVTAIESRSQLLLSPEAEILLDAAMMQRGTPGDIAEWARRIADDVGGSPD